MVQSCNVNSWSYFVLDLKKNQKIRFIPGFKQKWNPITSCEMPNPESSPTTSWTLHKLYKTNSFRSSESTVYHGLKNIQGMEPGTHILHTLLVNQLSHCFIERYMIRLNESLPLRWEYQQVTMQMTLLTEIRQRVHGEGLEMASVVFVDGFVCQIINRF